MGDGKKANQDETFLDKMTREESPNRNFLLLIVVLLVHD